MYILDKDGLNKRKEFSQNISCRLEVLTTDEQCKEKWQINYKRKKRVH